MAATRPKNYGVSICAWLALAAVIACSYLLPGRRRNQVAMPLFVLLPFISILILDGAWLGLAPVASDYWGGFSLNVLLAAASIIVAFPLSLLWALGRRSGMPFIRSVCVILIEFFRGVPVLALFFMGSVMLPLFFPEGTNVDKLLRVWIVLTLFMSGYMAEVFRGRFSGPVQGPVLRPRTRLASATGRKSCWLSCRRSSRSRCQTSWRPSSCCSRTPPSC